MDNLMTNSLTGKVAEKGLDNQVGKDTCCPDLGFKVRVICFLGMFIFGKCLLAVGFECVTSTTFRFRSALGLHWMHEPVTCRRRWFQYWTIYCALRCRVCSGHRRHFFPFRIQGPDGKDFQQGEKDCIHHYSRHIRSHPLVRLHDRECHHLHHLTAHTIRGNLLVCQRNDPWLQEILLLLLQSGQEGRSLWCLGCLIRYEGTG